MANHKSALKRVRSSERKRQRNRVVRSRARTEIRKALTHIENGDLEEARAATQAAVRTLDKAAGKGILHKNNTSRRKSRLMQQLAQLEAQQNQS
ncbi:MAG: 30S ribosomal protein S20 [Chloroflexi bacterium]|nr:30S ribosomal protein S20 [Chloroflexota bacterium]